MRSKSVRNAFCPACPLSFDFSVVFGQIEHAAQKYFPYWDDSIEWKTQVKMKERPAALDAEQHGRFAERPCKEIGNELRFVRLVRCLPLLVCRQRSLISQLQTKLCGQLFNECWEYSLVCLKQINE
jgi:hypothetical protein